MILTSSSPSSLLQPTSLSMSASPSPTSLGPPTHQKAYTAYPSSSSQAYGRARESSRFFPARPLPTFFRSAAVLYFLLMTYVVLGMLNEVRPMWYFDLAAVLFVLSQLDFFLLSKVICNVCIHSSTRIRRARSDRAARTPLERLLTQN